jgi:hypothetical protein
MYYIIYSCILGFELHLRCFCIRCYCVIGFIYSRKPIHKVILKDDLSINILLNISYLIQSHFFVKYKFYEVTEKKLSQLMINLSQHFFFYQTLFLFFFPLISLILYICYFFLSVTGTNSCN